jgi:hypothetical protein
MISELFFHICKDRFGMAGFGVERFEAHSLDREADRFKPDSFTHAVFLVYDWIACR